MYFFADKNQMRECLRVYCMSQSCFPLFDSFSLQLFIYFCLSSYIFHICEHIQMQFVLNTRIFCSHPSHIALWATVFVYITFIYFINIVLGETKEILLVNCGVTQEAVSEKERKGILIFNHSHKVGYTHKVPFNNWFGKTQSSLNLAGMQKRVRGSFYARLVSLGGPFCSTMN